MNFTVYSKPGCPYCDKVVSVLQLAELKYVQYELDRDFTREAFYGQFGDHSTFPQVVCEVSNIGGWNETDKYLQDRKLV